MQRLRAALRLILLGLVLLTIRDLWSEPSALSPWYWIRLVDALVAAALLRLLRAPRIGPWVPSLALLASISLCLDVLGVSVLRHDLVMPPIVLIGSAMFAAALFPWGPRWQMASAIAAATALLANAWLITGGIAAAQAPAGIAALSVFVGSVYIAYALERSRRALEERTLELEGEVVERRRAELALQGNERRYRLLAEQQSDIIWTLDPNSRFTYLSPSVQRLRGYTAEEAMALSLEQTLTPASLAVARALMAEELNGEPPGDDSERGSRAIELEHTCKDGSTIWLELTTNFVRDAHGRVSEIIGVGRDVRKRKKAELELRLAKESAEAANRSKSEFLANMSHEIRTPMNGIIGMTDLTLNTALSAEQREYLDMVRSSADSLMTVVNDILDFSKVDAGKLELDPQSFAVRESLGETLKTLGLRAATKDLELVYRVAPEVPAVLVGDAGRVRQVLVNLVGNAIKFTAAGEVVVRVGVESRSADTIDLHFAVTDTGIGIPDAERQRIFQPFEQADGSTTRRYGGTGLGLAISGRLVALMEGWLWVESEPGSGSTFHFTARFGVAAQPGVEQHQRVVRPLRALPVLIVDDNATSRRLLYEMLADWQMHPTMADGAVTAVRELQRAAALGSPYPVVLIDAQMPDLNGFAVAERIQHAPELAGTTIMMLSSGDLPRDTGRCRALGVAASLTKPIKQSELLDALLAVMGYAPRAAPAAPPIRVPAEAPRRPLRILLAEDNPVNQRLVKRLLEKRGHQVAVAANGLEALALLPQGPFDVVLMDVQMPEMDGFDATAAIRVQEQTSGEHVPIIAITAHSMKGDQERCLAAGMDGYVSKPISAQGLFAEIDRFVLAAPPGHAAQTADIRAEVA